MNKNYILILILSLISFTGCTSAVNIDDGVIRTEDGTTIINPHTKTLTIQDYFESCSHNRVGDDCYVVRKFGENDNVGGTIEPVSNGGVYQTPQTLTTLDIVSDDADDTFLGLGARQVEIQGLSTDWELTTEIVNMSGTTPVTLANQYYRVFRMKVLNSGTYATQVAGSHQGNIELRGVVGNELWAEISINGVALGQTEIAVFTVPKGYHAHLGTIFMHNNGNKLANIFMFVRNNASNVVAPYESMRIQFQIHGLQGSEILLPKSISGGMPETSDIGFMANADTGTTEVSVDYEILLVKND